MFSFHLAVISKVKPAYLLASLIILGWVIGVVGDQISVFPVIQIRELMLEEVGYLNATVFLEQFNILVVNYHQYYQLFSSNFVTDSFEDAVFNAIAVLILDRISDSTQFNLSRYMCVFLFSAIVGNILSLVAGPFLLSAGASGGIFGLYAAIFSFSWAEEKKIDRATLGIFLIIFIASSLLPNVNYYAHLGGAIGGFITGPLLYQILSPKIQSYSDSSKSSMSTKVIVSLVVIAMVLGTILQFYFFVT